MNIAMMNTLAGMAFPSLDVCFRDTKRCKRQMPHVIGFPNAGNGDG